MRALWFRDFKDFVRKAHPGSLHFGAPDRDGTVRVDCFCPCGCGGRGVFRTSLPDWNGSKDSPTIGHTLGLDHWTGRLQHGYWVAA